MNHNENIVARNLKRIREDRNLSLDRLSRLTGVSKSMLRQIETGGSSPTIATIWKIANGLRLSFTSLLIRRSPDVAISDFGKEKPLMEDSGRYRLFPLVPFDPERSFEVYYLEIDPGGVNRAEPHHGHVEEYIFVTRGTLEVIVDETRYTVNANQCVRFLADSPHRYRSVGEEPVNALMQLCYLP